MIACEKHDNCIVVFSNAAGCPLCKIESAFKTILEALDKSLNEMKGLKQTIEGAGLNLSKAA